MLDKVAATIRRYNMLTYGERVCVALSGGADSVSLLLALRELGYDVFASHVNHNLRGSESDKDEEFCKSLCGGLGVKLYVDSVDVRGYCEKNKLSIEEGARKLRYKAIQKHLDGCKLCTAHNLNDCFETTIFNLVRGCGIGGLAGIPPVRGFIVRPLLGVTRQEVEKFLRDRDQPYVTDSTNLEDGCSRNVIRLNVVPQLERINPSLYKTYSKTLRTFESADRFINKSAELELRRSFDGEGYHLKSVKDELLLSQMIFILLKENDIEPSFEKIDAVRQLVKKNDRINIAVGVYVRGNAGRISFEGDDASRDFIFPCDMTSSLSTGKYRIEFTGISQFRISDYNKKDLKWFIDTRKPVGQTAIRSYDGNEKIKLFGRDFTSTVKKLLQDAERRGAFELGVRKKDRVVISDDLGPIFVQGFGVAERAACDQETNSAVRVDIFKDS